MKFSKAFYILVIGVIAAFSFLYFPQPKGLFKVFKTQVSLISNKDLEIIPKREEFKEQSSVQDVFISDVFRMNLPFKIKEKDLAADHGGRLVFENGAVLAFRYFQDDKATFESVLEMLSAKPHVTDLWQWLYSVDAKIKFVELTTKKMILEQRCKQKKVLCIQYSPQLKLFQFGDVNSQLSMQKYYENKSLVLYFFAENSTLTQRDLNVIANSISFVQSPQ